MSGSPFETLSERLKRRSAVAAAYRVRRITWWCVTLAVATGFVWVLWHESEPFVNSGRNAPPAESTRTVLEWRPDGPSLTGGSVPISAAASHDLADSGSNQCCRCAIGIGERILNQTTIGCASFHLPGGKWSSQRFIKGLYCPDMSSTCIFNVREVAKCKPLKAAHFAASRA